VVFAAKEDAGGKLVHVRRLHAGDLEWFL